MVSPWRGAGSLPELFGAVARHFRAVLRVLRVAIGIFLSVTVVVTALPLYRLSEFSNPSAANWFSYSVSIHLLRWAEGYFLPAGETVLALGPWDTFLVLMYIGAGIGLLVTVPYLILRLSIWLSPGLKVSERRAIRRLGGLSLILFFGGALLGAVVLPWLYLFSFQIQAPAGVAGTVSVVEFVSETLLFTIGLGLAFEIPTICAGLAHFGLLGRETMKRNAGWMVIACFAAAWVISPGVGGGLIELPIGVVLSSLLLLSYVLVSRIERSREAGSVHELPGGSRVPGS